MKCMLLLLVLMSGVLSAEMPTMDPSKMNQRFATQTPITTTYRAIKPGESEAKKVAYTQSKRSRLKKSKRLQQKLKKYETIKKKIAKHKESDIEVTPTEGVTTQYPASNGTFPTQSKYDALETRRALKEMRHSTIKTERTRGYPMPNLQVRKKATPRYKPGQAS